MVDSRCPQPLHTTALFFFARQDRYLAGGKGFAARGPERDAPDETGAFEPGAVGGEGQE